MIAWKIELEKGYGNSVPMLFFMPSIATETRSELGGGKVSEKSWVAVSARNETISERYKSVSGFTHGFDYLRIILAAAVVLQHSILSSYGGETAGHIWATWGRPLLAPILVMFFGLSGFLVSGSLKKNPTVSAFMTLRALRLVPALAVEVFLSALILGPIFTILPLKEYFTNWYFIRYFGNILGRIHLDLPGVFLNLPYPRAVNLSLWTIPYELECYILLMAIYVFKLFRPARILFLIAFGIAIGTYYAFADYDPYWVTNRPLPRALIVAFLVGVAFNLLSDKVRLSWKIAAVALSAMILFTLDYRTVYLATIPAVYLCIFVGMMHPPKIGPLFTGDYSYGLYLFAFPLQQAYTALFPSARYWYANFTFAVVAGLLYAVFSWWCIEKPVLQRKTMVVRWVEDGVGNFRKRIGMPRKAKEIAPPRIG